MTTDIKFGFSAGVFSDIGTDLETRAIKLLELGTEAIEIGAHTFNLLDESSLPSQSFYDNVSKFKYVSVHAQTQNMRYPCDPDTLDKLLFLADKTQAQTVVFHPDVVDDFSWIIEKFGHLVAFENMDKLKTFGQTSEDMEKVFAAAPAAKFVMDLNHVYTTSSNMENAQIFHEKFGDRLAHYHISGFQNLHEFLYKTLQPEIIRAIRDFSVPILHEGILQPGDSPEEVLRLEKEYVLKNLSNSGF